MCFEVTSTLLGIGIHTLFYTIFVVGGSGNQCDEERVPSTAERRAYFWHAIVMGTLTILFVSTTVLGVREQESKSTYLCWTSQCGYQTTFVGFDIRLFFLKISKNLVNCS